MSTDPRGTDPIPGPVPLSWLLLSCAFLITGAAWLSVQIPYPLATHLRVLLLVLGLLLAAGAVILRPTPLLLTASAFIPFLAHGSMDEEWDTARLLLRIMLVAALAAGLLATVSRRLRKFIVSMLAVAHFLGILVTASLSPPPGAEAPWLSLQLWAYVYRPYLNFICLDMRYNFYAPDPVSDTIFRYRVEFANGDAAWYRLPDRAECRTALEFSRALAIPEFVSGQAAAPDDFARLTRLREDAGENHIPPLPMPNIDPSAQYEEPSPDAKLYIESYAHHIAVAKKHPTDPGQAVTGVKIYRVGHNVPSAKQVSEGMDPNDPTLYSAIYLGEYGADGKLKPSCYHVEVDKLGQIIRETRDPFLYWLIPIIREKDGTVTDFVKLHGDAHAEAKP